MYIIYSRRDSSFRTFLLRLLLLLLILYYYIAAVAGQLFERKLDLCVPHKLRERETDKFTVHVSAAVVVVVHSHCLSGATLLYTILHVL